MRPTWVPWALAAAALGFAMFARRQQLRQDEELIHLANEHHRQTAAIASLQTEHRAASRPRPVMTQSLRRSTEQAARNDDLTHQQLRIAKEKAEISAKYHEFEIQRKLTPDQIARFEACLSERQTAAADASAAVQHQGFALGSPGFNQLISTTLLAKSEESVNTLKEILGADGYAAMTDYDHTYGARHALGVFAGTAAVSGAALTESQLQALSQAVAPQLQPNGGTDWSTTYPAAAKILTPAQFALYSESNLASKWAEERASISLFHFVLAANAMDQLTPKQSTVPQAAETRP